PHSFSAQLTDERLNVNEVSGAVPDGSAGEPDQRPRRTVESSQITKRKPRIAMSFESFQQKEIRLVAGVAVGIGFSIRGQHDSINLSRAETRWRELPPERLSTRREIESKYGVGRAFPANKDGFPVHGPSNDRLIRTDAGDRPRRNAAAIGRIKEPPAVGVAGRDQRAVWGNRIPAKSDTRARARRDVGNALRRDRPRQPTRVVQDVETTAMSRF